jgi:K(+)-stimulated pyrophosphate-energized sodium pump
MMKWFVLALFLSLAGSAEASMRRQETAPVHGGGEASLVLPDLAQVSFLGYNARTLLMGGLGICVLGLLFGLVSFNRLRALPVHRQMLEVSELIYETCKT